MPMKLVIVESPAKAKTIEKYLGEDYMVVASVGHVRDLPKSEKDAIDKENNYRPNYQIIAGKESVVKDIKKRALLADEIFLATDPDREGEAIAWHLNEAANLKDAKRIVFNEITKDAVLEAIKHPRKIDLSLKEAQEARRVLDRLFGYTLSKLIWTKLRYGLSAGRVQSPALRILMEREREIRAFIPEKYWAVEGILKTEGGVKIPVKCEKEFTDEKTVNQFVDIAPTIEWISQEAKEVEVNRAPKPPLITSTMQQAANSYLSLSPAQTMRFAQKLYEAGYITYMRTDSPILSAQAHQMIKTEVEKEYGAKFYKQTFYKTKKKTSQEAHEAIRPTKMHIKNAGRTDGEKRLYELIRTRTLSSQMIPAKLKRSAIYFKSDAPILRFVVRGTKTINPGWLLAMPFSKNEEIELPNIKKDESCVCIQVNKEEKETSPPNRYSEAGLVKELEKRELGRPSTYAPTIRTLVTRSYVEKEGRTLYPTLVGEVVSSFLEKNFNQYIEDKFTAKMEEQLDEIAEGKRKYEKTLTDFYIPFEKAVLAKKDIEKLTILGDAPPDILCPKCDGQMVKRLSRSDFFLSCKKFPDCDGARQKDGTLAKEPEPTGEKCPKCKKGDLIKKSGKFGDFIGCNKYPKCKFIKEDEEELARKDSGVACTKCDDGTMIERRGRFGIFYSCKNYPNCKYAIKAKPTGRKCDMCKSLMMDGTKTIPERCSDKKCPMHRPDKLNKK